MRYPQSVVFALALIGCGGDQIPGIGPTVKSTHPDQHGRMRDAIHIIGQALRDTGLDDVSPIVDAELLDGYSFDNGDADPTPLWGHNELALNPRGLRCVETIATRDQSPPFVFSALSLTHEMTHCSLDVMLSPDPRHEQRDVWDRIVPNINATLAAYGL